MYLGYSEKKAIACIIKASKLEPPGNLLAMEHYYNEKNDYLYRAIKYLERAIESNKLTDINDLNLNKMNNILRKNNNSDNNNNNMNLDNYNNFKGGKKHTRRHKRKHSKKNTRRHTKNK